MKYFFDRNITIKRLRHIDINRSIFSSTGTAVGYPASFQEPSPETLQMYEGNIGNMYSCFVDIDCPAQDADHVIIRDVEYAVRDVKTMDFGAFQYKRLIIIKNDDV